MSHEAEFTEVGCRTSQHNGCFGVRLLCFTVAQQPDPLSFITVLGQLLFHCTGWQKYTCHGWLTVVPRIVMVE